MCTNEGVHIFLLLLLLYAGFYFFRSTVSVSARGVTLYKFIFVGEKKKGVVRLFIYKKTESEITWSRSRGGGKAHPRESGRTHLGRTNAF